MTRMYVLRQYAAADTTLCCHARIYISSCICYTYLYKKSCSSAGLWCRLHRHPAPSPECHAVLWCVLCTFPPQGLDRDELLFIERLMVISLRLIAEFLPIRAYFLLHKKTSSHCGGVSSACRERRLPDHREGKGRGRGNIHENQGDGGGEDASSFLYQDVDGKDGYVNIIRKTKDNKKEEENRRRRKEALVKSPVEIWIEPAVLQLLALIVHLHPNVYMLQTERITAALQVGEDTLKDGKPHPWIRVFSSVLFCLKATRMVLILHMAGA